jgi:hypothetical protein
VPYSPEYRAGGTDENFLDALARRTGGRLIRDPEQAFVHDLPAVGAPRPLWPYLLVLAAVLFVADVGVRRVRITGPEIRAAYYAIRKRLGYVDTPTVVRAPRGAPTTAPSLGLISVNSPSRGPAQPAPVELTRPGRLLAAKQRAARR